MSRTILHVADFAAPYPGAFITQLRMLDAELKRRRTGQCAFAFPPSAESTAWYQRLRSEGSYVATVSASPTRGLFAAAGELAEMAQETGASVIHSHFGSYDVSAMLAVRRMRRRGLQCLLLWHYRTALEEGVDRRSLRRRVKDLLRYRLAGRTVDRCLAVTHALALEASRRGMGAKASALTAGCDIETFHAQPTIRARVRAELGLEADDILILHMGWAWERKGGDLLAAAARLLERKGHARLVFVSVGAPKEAPPVRSLPFTDRISEIHQAADIFVSASRSEGFGNGVVEAMSCGAVVVATLAAGQREVFEGIPGCVAVPVDDAQSLADGIEYLLTRRAEWPLLGAANRDHVTTHYNMRDWARRMADVYDTSLSARTVLR